MELKPIATGYCFLEAPRSNTDGLWFTDLLIGGVYRLSPNGKTDVFLADQQHIGGIAINEDGKIICGGKKGLLWLDPATGKSGVFLDTVDGKRIAGANDMCTDKKGGLYFGTLSAAGEYDQGPTLTQLYYVNADGSAKLVRDGVKFSNGIGLSPDGKRLYHVESLLSVFVYDVLPDGSLTNRAVFSTQEDGDGMAVDAEGGVWIASFARGEVTRYRPDGSVDRRLSVPQKVVASVCFGGPDWRDLYVVTAGNEGIDRMMKGEMPPREATIYHTRSDIPGLPVPQTRFRIQA